MIPELFWPPARFNRGAQKRPRVRTRSLPCSLVVRRSVDHLHHVRQPGDRAADLGSVLELDHAVHLAETEAGQDLLLCLGPADRRADLLDLDLRHVSYSAIASAAASASASLAPPRPSRSATFLPRRWATDFGEDWLPSASNVARIML